MSVLDRIVDTTKEEVRRRQEEVPLKDLEAQLAGRGDDRPFAEALTRPGIAVIAEHKRRSPSAGTIRAGASVTDIVTSYDRGGASAPLDPHRGTPLRWVARRSARGPRGLRPADPAEGLRRQALPGRRVRGRRRRRDPADRRGAGDKRLAKLHAHALELDLDVLVEVHDAQELERALEVIEPTSSASTTGTSPTSPSTSSAPTNCCRTSRREAGGVRVRVATPASSSRTSNVSGSTRCWSERA